MTMKGSMGPPSCGLTTCERGHWSQVQSELGGGQSWGPWRFEASSRDMERYLSGREGDWAGAVRLSGSD